MLELELIQKKNFNILKISPSVATIEINSSYENINRISDNKYIFDVELRELTKNFIQNIIRISNTFLHDNSNNKKEISSCIKNDNYLSLQNTYGIKNKKSIKIRHLFSNSEKNNNKKVNLNTKSNIQHFLNSIIKSPKNHENQVGNFLNKVKNINNSSINLKPVPNGASVNLGKTKFINILNNEGEKYKNSKITSMKNNANNNNVKKKKKQKELDIISVNIQKGSQILNQPDIFYAGLFSELINKSTTNINANKSKNKDNNKDIIK